jgi:hypothetical protein
MLGLLTGACADKPPIRFEVTDTATDTTYGYSQGNPIRVGGYVQGQGPANRDRFFKALRGPQGQPVTYVSNGSCCPFKTDDSAAPVGLLEVLVVTYNGSERPAILYVDMFNFQSPRAPVGFTVERQPAKATGTTP